MRAALALVALLVMPTATARADLQFNIWRIAVTTTTTTTTTTAAPTTTTTLAYWQDAFTRANGTLCTGNWTAVTEGGSNNLKIVSNMVTANSTSAEDELCYFTSGPPSNDSMYACAKVEYGTGSQAYIAICESSTKCFVVMLDAAPATDAIVVYTQNSTTWTQLTTTNCGGSGGFARNFADGEYLGVRRTGETTYRIAYSTNGTSWTDFGSGDCSSTLLQDSTNNYGALGAYYLAATTDGWDDFEHGSGATLPTGHACGQ